MLYEGLLLQEAILWTLKSHFPKVVLPPLAYQSPVSCSANSLHSGNAAGFHPLTGFITFKIKIDQIYTSPYYHSLKSLKISCGVYLRI